MHDVSPHAAGAGRRSPFSFQSAVRRLAAAFGLIAALALPHLAVAQDTEPTALSAEEKDLGYSLRRVLAKPRADLAAAEVTAAEKREGLQTRRTFEHLENLRVIELDASEEVAAAVDRLRATGRYEFVELDYIVRADAVPNDPRYLAGEQWALRNTGQNNGKVGADIKAEAAWDIQTSASDVVVAVMDSGLRQTHEDIANNLWRNTAESANDNGLDEDGNGYIDDRFGINSTLPKGSMLSGIISDVQGHGTAVSSVIGAAGGNGVGMTGVAWNARLMTLRFLDADGFGLISDEVECLDYAIAKGAKIVNASFGGANYSQSLYDALKRARDAGIIVVCSAGNDAENSDEVPHYPSSYLLDNIVSVANTTRTDALSTTSTYGAGTVDLGAPGSSILVASSTNDRGYTVMSGTSFSAPMVTGALALLKAKFPNDSYRASINRLLRSVDKIDSLTGKTSTGGRLNLDAALRSTVTRPFNDDFATRARYEGEFGIARSGAQLATRETGEPTHGGAAGSGSLWWTWTAPRSGALTIETTGSAYDTLLSVYTGNAIDALTSVASNDDQSGATTSKVSFNAVAGTTYQIAIDAKGTGTGLAVLRLSLTTGNDAFASAQTVTGRSWSIAGDNRSASRETGEPLIRNNAGGYSLWYRWVAPATRRYHLTAWGNDTFDSMLAVYTGTRLDALTEITSATTGGDSNYTMADGAVTFTATAGTTYYIAVDSQKPASGSTVTGTFKLACIDSEWEFFGVGGVGTPAIASDGTLHFTDSVGYAYGLNPDGTRKWRYALSGTSTFAAPAVANDGTVYIGDNRGIIYALRPDGTFRWGVSIPASLDASPAISAEGTNVYVRTANGRLYQLPVANNGLGGWSILVGGTNATSTYASPVVAPDGTIYCPGTDSKLYAIRPDGTLKWTYATDFLYASPAIAADGTIYLGVSSPGNKLLALNPDGTLKWSVSVGGTVSSSAAIGLDGTIYFGCADKKVYAVSPAGAIRWSYETGDEIRNTSPLVAADGAIYIGSLDGKLYVLEPDGQLRRSYSTANELRASPILHNGRLYIASNDYRLYSIEVGQVPASTAWPMHRNNAQRTARPQNRSLGIGVQPKAQSSEIGVPISFTVGAQGTGPLTYQWLFNGQPIAGATSTTYTIDPATHASGGDYSVRITDPTGSTTSSTVKLTITTPLVAPTVFTAPASRSAVAGESVVLSVTAAGTNPFTYQWLRDGTAIQGATSSTLTFNPVRVGDTANYTVRITNIAGNITSPAAALNVGTISRLSNLSIRSKVGGSVGMLTVGITVGGVGTDGTKSLLLRAAGPTLGAFGVDGTLADPRLAVVRNQQTVAQNDDWAGNADVVTMNNRVGAFGFSSPTSKDAALPYSTGAAAYSVQVTGAGDSSGVALAEIYDATASDEFLTTTPRLTNISAFTHAGTGNDILITGFSISGSTPKTVLIRGVGPALAAFGVTNALADPKLELWLPNASTPMSINDNWSTATNVAEVEIAAKRVGAFDLARDSRDAVLLVTLPPGTYSAQVSGMGGTTGIALVEVYEVP